jgi:large subunit ribosomal protein L21
MYAVIKTGGKQYRVQAGDLLVVEKLAGEPGAKVAFDEVLMIGEGESVTLGAPLIAGASVSATLVETRKADKIKVFKKIRRQGYRRTRGHRQIETVVRVTGIDGDGKNEAWTGEVDLTPLAELRARARNLARQMDDAKAKADARAAFRSGAAERPAKVTKPVAAKPAKKAAPAKAEAKAGAPAAKAKAPAKTKAAAAPKAPAKTKAAAAPKAPAKTAPKAPAKTKAAAPKAAVAKAKATAKPAAKAKPAGKPKA